MWLLFFLTIRQHNLFVKRTHKIIHATGPERIAPAWWLAPQVAGPEIIFAYVMIRGWVLAVS